MELTKGKAYDLMDLPAITRALHMLILYFQDQVFEAWWAHFIRAYPHLHCLILDKIATLVATFHTACVNPEIVQAAMQGNPPGSSSAFALAIRYVLQFVQELEGYIKNMHIGAFITPTPLYRLWYTACHPPPRPLQPAMLPPQPFMLLPPLLQLQVFAN